MNFDVFLGEQNEEIALCKEKTIICVQIIVFGEY